MLLIADGFSCREQIRQQTGRTALHLAQVIQMAIARGYVFGPDQTVREIKATETGGYHAAQFDGLERTDNQGEGR
jgi:hypothetical protein